MANIQHTAGSSMQLLESYRQKFLGFVEAVSDSNGVEQHHEDPFLRRNGEAAGKTRTSRRSDACFDADEAVVVEQPICVVPSLCALTNVLSVQNRAGMVPSADDLPKVMSAHAVYAQSNQIGGARVIAFVHEAVWIGEASAHHVQLSRKSIHVKHEQTHM